ncbi:hypothetical protein [Marispirochaeta aestuarii]|uniref:hypothetical protein n=1 Tax=Marispirochaeta aestuarii TaxID=1963862 RepID=UPI0029C89E6F|nr:hypothetical protein [Marispirochaeta aestuarii]
MRVFCISRWLPGRMILRSRNLRSLSISSFSMVTAGDGGNFSPVILGIPDNQGCVRGGILDDGLGKDGEQILQLGGMG